MDKIAEVEKEFIKKDRPDFKTGDTVKVTVKIKEGDKTRLQAFEGIVIAKKGSGVRESFTVRRVSYGEGVERTFLLHSPTVDSISITRRGKVRRARLYYLRERTGKQTRLEEERVFEEGQDKTPVGKEGVS